MRVNLSSYETLTYKNNWPDTPQNFQRNNARNVLFCFCFCFCFLFCIYFVCFFFMPNLHILAWKLQFWPEIFNLTYWVTSILGSLHTHTHKNTILAYTEWPFFQRNFTWNASSHFVLRQARLRHFHNWESPHPVTHWQKHTTYTRLSLNYIRPRGVLP